MQIEGGCYCGAVRYEASGDPVIKAQCHCRECQYISGGSANVVMGMHESGFRYTRGTPKQFRRSDIADPVTREFCAECGTHLLTRTPRAPGVAVIKVGTFDDTSLFDGPQIAINTAEKTAFQVIPEGVHKFEHLPQ